MRVKIASLMLALSVVSTATAFAGQGDRSVEATFNYGTEAFDGIGGQLGVTAGFGYECQRNLQGRIDVSYFRSTTKASDAMEGGKDFGGTRVPIDLGVRYFYPLTKIDSDLKAYGQGGLEVSFDDWEPSADAPSRSRTRVGGVIGAGVEYMLDPNYAALLNMQYHIIENSYLSLAIGIGYHF